MFTDTADPPQHSNQPVDIARTENFDSAEHRNVGGDIPMAEIVPEPYLSSPVEYG